MILSRQISPSAGSSGAGGARAPAARHTPHVVVVGAGVGGLVSAALLARRGLRVTVLEAADEPGGKLRPHHLATHPQPVDAGPTVFTMRWVFEELCETLGESIAERLPMERVHALARHAWGAGATLDLYSDMHRSADAIAALCGPGQARGYLDFCARAQGIYQTLDAPWLRSTRPNPLSLTWRVGLRGLPGLLAISPFARLWDELGRYFDDPRLLQLFGRYATYCGSSPFTAPATLMLVAHVEREGVWLLRGGMSRLAAALASMAEAQGAQIRCAAAVSEVLHRDARACGVRLADGSALAADAVVFNGDAAALGALCDPAARAAQGERGSGPRAARSLSAVTWTLAAPTSGFDLLRHNVFFSDDYAAEFRDLAAGRLPQAPTVYVCAQDREAGPLAPGAPERLLCLVNAPATGDASVGDTSAGDTSAGDTAPTQTADLDRCEAAAFALLQRCGLHVQRGSLTGERRTGPAEFARAYPGTGGALYGQATQGWRSSFTRPGTRAALGRLYRAGGSTHPGPGVPMAALSGMLAARMAAHDLGAGLP